MVRLIGTTVKISIGTTTDVIIKPDKTKGCNTSPTWDLGSRTSPICNDPQTTQRGQTNNEGQTKTIITDRLCSHHS